jgi:hypothetical protein
MQKIAKNIGFLGKMEVFRQKLPYLRYCRPVYRYS